MSEWPPQPVLYEINTALWLHGLSAKYAKRITLGTVPAGEIQRLAAYRLDGVWLMGVWERSPASRNIARSHPGLQVEYRRALPDFGPQDVIGSPFAVYWYAVDREFGGDEELADLRRRLNEAGLRLVLDFVSNHLARDHDWVANRASCLLEGTPDDLESSPGSYFPWGGRVFAHGRDPNFPAWTDTVQIDYRQPETRYAIIGLLLGLAGRCDGLRCDMAMLVTSGVFCRTWGGSFDPPGAEFWPDAIRAVKRLHPGFLMLAEVYWDMEYDLQQQGFDYTYDKRLYDRLERRDAGEVRAHLAAGIDYQRRLARFVENHDEERSAAVFGAEGARTAAVLALALPGMRLLQEGQFGGSKVRVPVQLMRSPAEDADPETEKLYARLLETLRSPLFHQGQWKLLSAREAWHDNPTHRAFVIYRWTHREDLALVVSNLSPERAQCYVPLECPGLAGRAWALSDALSDARYERSGDAMLGQGLYLDVPGDGRHIFRFAAR
ncbi:MAG TPA: alpha-amylase family glycosyl hydrolase [Bryobacteraceae bacterium]|nr:alpha-amylase family glycosyl hydrolase [Bryobacteraceae bacterium]